MSFVKHGANLPGSPLSHKYPLKRCSRCDEDRVPEGGIDMSPTKWVCAACWVRRSASSQQKKKK